MSLLVTCEVGGSKIPACCQSAVALGSLDRSPIAVAVSQQDGSQQDGSIGEGQVDPLRRVGFTVDRPARYAATRMAEQLGAELIINECPIELIDVARSLRHRQLYSKLTRGWTKSDREKLVNLVYRPYRERLQSAIQGLLSRNGFAIHLSVRSFNLRSRGKIRRTDVGLLYDPSRGDELDLCLDWIDEMWDRVAMLRVRRNYPRRGTANGLIKWLRSEFSGQDYLGVEVWLNRAWAQRAVPVRDEAIAGICESMQAILDSDQGAQTQAA